MDENKGKEKDPLKLVTRLELQTPALMAEKPPKNLVTKRKHGAGYIRFMKKSGHIYFYLCHSEYRHGKTPRQVIDKYLGQSLPRGVRLGPVDEKTRKRLLEGK